MGRQLGIATGACVDCPILRLLPSIHGSGTGGVELGTPPAHFDPAKPDQVLVVQRALAELSLQPVSIHAPFGGRLDLADPDPDHRHAARAAIATASSALKRLGGRIVVVHPSDMRRQNDDLDERLEACADSLAIVAADLHQAGMTLALETPLPHLVGGHPDEFAWLLRRTADTVQVCLDVGHTWLGAHWDEFARIADGRVVHVHAHDNHGAWDDHLPPGQGRIDWRRVTETLDAMQFEQWIMLELRCVPGDMRPYFRDAWRESRRVLAFES